jgi:hypothetical protein
LVDRRAIDLERFLRSRVAVTNDSGGRAYDTGLRTFDCPFCGDRYGRGWLSVKWDPPGGGFWAAGCFNAGCVAEPKLRGGAVEWARRVLGLAGFWETMRYLEENYSGQRVTWAPPPPRGSDFCRFPKGMRAFDSGGSAASILEASFARFIKRQWGISQLDARRWGLGWCLTGPHAWRVIIPVVINAVPVGFQARSIRGAEPKYVTSRHGPESDPASECARPASAMLFNADGIRTGEDLLLVEGAGDVMGWRGPTPAAALLGVALTPEKLAMITLRAPRRVVVALDDEPSARRRAMDHVDALLAWGVPATLGQWVGGKDAGSGATLEEVAGGESLLGKIEQRLRG